MGFVNERIEIGKWQTIDRERDIVLRVESGPGPDNDWRFHLTCPEGDIYFRAYQRRHKVEGGYHIEWIILQIFASDHVKQDKTKLHELITEAMGAFGFAAGKSEHHLRVIVTFSRTFDPNI